MIPGETQSGGILVHNLLSYSATNLPPCPLCKHRFAWYLLRTPREKPSSVIKMHLKRHKLHHIPGHSCASHGPPPNGIVLSSQAKAALEVTEQMGSFSQKSFKRCSWLLYEVNTAKVPPLTTSSLLLKQLCVLNPLNFSLATYLPE